MPRRKSDEPVLCPECPRLGYLHLVKPRSWTRTRTETSSLKLCAKLRRLKLSDALACPYYPKSESLDLFGKKRRRRRK